MPNTTAIPPMMANQFLPSRNSQSGPDGMAGLCGSRYLWDGRGFFKGYLGNGGGGDCFLRLGCGGFGCRVWLGSRGFFPHAVFQLGQAQTEIGEIGRSFGDLPSQRCKLFRDVLPVVVSSFIQWRLLL